MFPYAQMGLKNREEIRAYKKALVAADRKVRFRARLRTHEGKGVRIKLTVVGGEVIVDVRDPGIAGGTEVAEDSPSRTATVRVHDPHHRIRGGRTQPQTGQSIYGKYVHVEAGVWVTELAEWIDCPIFDGQIVEVEREGDFVTLSAEGRDGGHIDPALFPRAFAVRRHTRVHQGIRRILSHRGERRFDFPAKTRRLARDHAWRAGKAPWSACVRLAKSIDMQLYARGDGTFRLRTYPTKACWRFTDGQDCVVVGQPREIWSRLNARNLVIGRGRGKRKRNDEQHRPVRARSQLPDRHPLSKKNLGRDLVEIIDAPQIRKAAKLKRRTDSVLRRLSKLAQEISFTCRPIFHLEELDVVALKHSGLRARVRLQSFNIPLDDEGQMVVNYTRNVLPAGRRGK